MAVLDIILVAFVIILIVIVAVLAYSYVRKSCNSCCPNNPPFTATCQSCSQVAPGCVPGPTGYVGYYCDPTSNNCIVSDAIPTGWQGSNRPGNDIVNGGIPMGTTGATGYQLCLQKCLQTAGCVGVAYNTTGGVCYPKSTIGTPSNINNNVSAVVTTPLTVQL